MSVCARNTLTTTKTVSMSLSAGPLWFRGAGPKALTSAFPYVASSVEGASPSTYHLVCLHCLDYCQDYSPGSDSRAFLRLSGAVVVIMEGDGEVMQGCAESGST